MTQRASSLCLSSRMGTLLRRMDMAKASRYVLIIPDEPRPCPLKCYTQAYCTRKYPVASSHSSEGMHHASYAPCLLFVRSLS